MGEFWKINNSGALVGTKKNHIKVNCLAFVDDLALQVEREEEAISQVNTLNGIAEKAGLQIPTNEWNLWQQKKTTAKK